MNKAIREQLTEREVKMAAAAIQRFVMQKESGSDFENLYRQAVLATTEDVLFWIFGSDHVRAALYRTARHDTHCLLSEELFDLFVAQLEFYTHGQPIELRGGDNG